MQKSRTFVTLAVALLLACAAVCHTVLADATHPSLLMTAVLAGAEKTMAAEIPARFVCDTVYGPHVEVTANAKVVGPGVGTPSTAAVKPRLLTLEECSKLAQILFGGQKMYAGGRLEKEARNAALLEKLRGDPASAEWICQFKQVQADLAALPKHAVQLEETASWDDSQAWTADVVSDGSDGLFRRLQCGADPATDACYILYTASDRGEPRIGSVWSTTSSAAVRQAQSFGLSGGELPHPDTLPAPAITADDAAAAAAAAVDELGLTDYTLQTADLVYGRINGSVQKGWLLNYARTVAGLPVVPPSGGHSGFRSQPQFLSSGGAGSTRRAEVLEILICDTGIVRLTWECPFTVEETVPQEAALLPFATVEKIFVETAPLMRLSADTAGGTKERIVITSARLALKYVPDEGRLVPAWCFYGSWFLLSGDTILETSGPADDPLLVLDALTGAALN